MNPNILISIGNSDNKLSQEQWSRFVREVRASLALLVDVGDICQHGEWFSAPDSPWQNANWCIQVRQDYRPGEHEYETVRDFLRKRLAQLRDAYQQDSIAWTEGHVEFLSAAS